MQFEKPKLIPLLITIPSITILLALGTWQYIRLIEKETFIDYVETRLKATPNPLPTQIENPKELEYKRVSLSGEFLHEQEFHLYMGTDAIRSQPGYQLITPLRRYDSGQLVLVNRGWIPAAMKDPETRHQYKEYLIENEGNQFEGIVQLSETPNRFTPKNDSEKNLWFYIDINAMAKTLDEPIQPVLVSRTGTPNKLQYPSPNPAKIKIRNDHLEYAITWYSLAVALIIIFLLYHRKKS